MPEVNDILNQMEAVCEAARREPRTGEELDAAIAREVMGYEPVPEGSVPQLRGPGWYRHPSETNEYVCDFESYSSDANAARLVLAEIERRGLGVKFVDELVHLFRVSDDKSRYLGNVWSWDWGFLTATPEAICLSALAAVRGGKG